MYLGTLIKPSPLVPCADFHPRKLFPTLLLTYNTFYEAPFSSFILSKLITPIGSLNSAKADLVQHTLTEPGREMAAVCTRMVSKKLGEEERTKTVCIELPFVVLFDLTKVCLC